jgi:hypothetical protein
MITAKEAREQSTVIAEINEKIWINRAIKEIEKYAPLIEDVVSRGLFYIEIPIDDMPISGAEAFKSLGYIVIDPPLCIRSTNRPTYIVKWDESMEFGK